jgi:hypothetical protein
MHELRRVQPAPRGRDGAARERRAATRLAQLLEAQQEQAVLLFRPRHT